MAETDVSDYYAEQERIRLAELAAQEEALRLWRSLTKGDEKLDPTGAELHRWRNEIHAGNRRPEEVRALMAQQHPREVVDLWLRDPKNREEFRKLLRGDADTLQALQIDPNSIWAGRDFSQQRENLDAVPVSFLGPDVTVKRSEVDTPEEAIRFLQAHGGDSEINRRMLKAALNYGGLAVEPTPFGFLTPHPFGTEWYRPKHEPGEIEARILQKYASGGEPTDAELSAIAQERQGSFRLRDEDAIRHMASKASLAGIFALGAGLVGGGAVAPALGLSSGGFGAGAVAGAAAGGAGSAVGGGGDIDDIWKGILLGGLSGGIGGGIGGAVGGGTTGNILGGAAGAGASNAAGQGLSGDGFDWQKFLLAIGSGAAGGAAGGLFGNSETGDRGEWDWLRGYSQPGGGSPLDMFARFGTGLGSSLLKGLGNDPFAGPNAQLDQRELERIKAQEDAMAKAQEEWKRRYAEAAGAQREAMLAAQREWQQQWEAQKAEYEAKLQAFLAEREAQIGEALKAMGVGEGGIGALLAERQEAIRAAKEQQALNEQQLIESRQFFPSQLLEQSPGDSEFATSGVLVPHSPPSVLFGQEGLPASFGDYSQTPAPRFSSEGLLPSGSLGHQEPPPMAAGGRRAPRYFPTLMGGLTRSPYLMRV